MSQPLLTYKDMAKKYGFPIGTLYGMVHKKEIPHVRLGERMVRFVQEEIDGWIKSKNSKRTNHTTTYRDDSTLPKRAPETIDDDETTTAGVSDGAIAIAIINSNLDREKKIRLLEALI